MVGAPRRVRRPVLLLLVFGMFLVIVGITATAQTVIVTANVSSATLNAVIQSDAATIRTFANLDLEAGDLNPSALSDARRAEVQGHLETLIHSGELLHLEVRLPSGLVILSDDPDAVGWTAAQTAEFSDAATGTPVAAIVTPADSEAAGTRFSTTSLVREYFPIRTDRTGDSVIAVVAIWRDAVPILAQVDAARRDVVLATVSAALITAVALFLVFRASQRRITRQAELLIESARRDPLTGTLNHGSLVDLLAAHVERARTADAPIAIAMLDIDNFRLLNEAHGHPAGDRALLLVAEQLSAALPASAEFGRYGPDEFLVIDPGTDAGGLLPVIEQLRTALAEMALQFDESERLPVSISGGLCAYPDDGTSVNSLLATASMTLQEAQVSGGNAIRLADLEAEAAPETRTFDVFQGLILAVDAKDRYTKRHSEDVSRYAVFLAEQLGLDADVIATIRVAGLLHDVGKIGIPDAILRRPGRLSDGEMEVVKQHVALGDMILRDLPDIDTIRIGVRHHHERWDGRGYLTGLAGDDIPLIARILAVGDTFSAMTTTRPYRKALDVREALVRLADAAGTQLDEDLVGRFVQGIEHDPNAPLPGIDAQHRLWTPYIRVA